MYNRLKIILVFCIVVLSVPIFAQQKIITGIVKDEHTDEALPFSSIIFKNSSIGTLADSAGKFTITLNNWPSDTLIISSVSYQPYTYILNKNLLTIDIVAALFSKKASEEVIIKAKAKHSRGWYLWRKVVNKKDENNIFNNDNFTYNVYNKLQVDIDNIQTQKLITNKLLRPFQKVLQNNIDTTLEQKPILPTFITETISNYYFQKKPNKTKEIIVANKISGIKNESITKYLGALNQNIIIYQNYIPIFDKEFIGPFNDNGDKYYNYRLADTQLINNQKFLHLIFIPKNSGNNTFTGDCWIHDSSFAVQKIILHVSKEANINYIDKVSIAQEFAPLPNKRWIIMKDKFYVNIHPIGKNNIGFILRKTTNYTQPIINNPNNTIELDKSNLKENISVADGARDKLTTYWDTARTEPLSKAEKGIYSMIDTIQQMPTYKRYYNGIYFLTTGYKNIAQYQIGPWFNWISGNAWEGTRVRFDIGTNKHFNTNIYLHGYVAFGFKDNIWKHKAEALWVLNRNKRQTLHASYINDLDYTQNYHTDLQNDNFLAFAIRKNGIPLKFIQLKQSKIEYFRDTKIGLSTTIGMANKIYTPLQNLPGKDLFTETNALTTTEISLKLRFAYLEKFFETQYFRYSLGSNYPIAELEYIQGIKGILKSNYNYQKLKLNINGQISVAPLGKINYTFFAGKVFGNLPYMLLEVHPGNELYLYNKFAFNLMNRFEYVSDKYAGFIVEHQIGNGLFKYTNITRKMKLRQFWNIKGVTGSMTNSNKIVNDMGNNLLHDLNNTLYLEVGTGIDNIFKLLRIDFVWRLLPQPLPAAKASRFGIFGSFKIQL